MAEGSSRGSTGALGIVGGVGIEGDDSSREVAVISERGRKYVGVEVHGEGVVK